MSVTSTAYLPIDKNIVTEGMVFDFTLFLIQDNDQVSCFKDSGSAVSSDDKLVLDEIKKLYVKSTEREDYETFYKEYLSAIPKDVYPSFQEKCGTTYSNASEILNNLFDNPETLGNYKKSKTVVNDLVETILDNDFTMKSLMGIAAYDYYTHTHSINVSIYALSLGSYLGLEKTALAELGEAALLHDLGKSKIDPKIINKNGKLTDEEFEAVKKHPNLGYALGIKMGIQNKNILKGIRHHHEKMDGSGYPSGLKSEGIPLYARIIGLCDIFDALTSKRSYKAAYTTFDALKLIKLQMSNHIDLKLLNNMIMMFKD